MTRNKHIWIFNAGNSYSGFLNISADITLTFALYGCATTKMSGTM